MTTAAQEAYRVAVETAWDLTKAIEPVPGADASKLGAIRAALQRAELKRAAAFEGMSDDDRADAEAAMIALLARAAGVAFAAGDALAGVEWLAAAEALSTDDAQRAALAAGRQAPERHRQLSYGRYLFAIREERAARKVWKKLAAGAASDAITRAAQRELDAPRPLHGTPTLWRLNGCGLGFYGARDRRPDGSYITTHCLSLAFVPVLPIGAYRVRGGAGGYQVFAREQLSRFARLVRWAMVAAVVLGIGGYASNAYLHDPDRLARGRFDDAIALEHGGDAEAALRAIDAELTGDDLARVGDGRAADAGAAVVRLTAGYLHAPFTRAQLDQANRVIGRYQALPTRARDGAARDAMLAELDGWIGALGGDGDREARLALLRRAAEISDDARRPAIAKRVSEARLAFAASKAADAPVDALAVLVEDPSDATAHARADALIATLVEQAPSLLEDNRADVEAWIAAAPAGAPRSLVQAKLTAAIDARTADEADGVTPAQLAGLQLQRPWDQRLAVLLAREELGAGKLDAAEARLRGFGPIGLLTRDARLMLGQIAEAQGKLELADQVLGELVASRLQRFVAASNAYDAAVRDLSARTDARLRSGDLPSALIDKLDAASEAEQRDLIHAWMSDLMERDPEMRERSAAYAVYADVVPQSIALGSVELRRAQALSGAARDAMLKRAEATFLAIRAQAEGQPDFHLALGEIYARLGKHAESEAEFAGLIAKDDPELSLQVVSEYRALGSVARAKEVATAVYEKASSPNKEAAAQMLGLLAEGDDDESERWYRKADPSNPYVRIPLMEIEASRLAKQGHNAECSAKLAEVAKAYLTLRGTSPAGYNNAALAHQRRFACSGDLAALRDAEDAMANAYAMASAEPVVVGNYADLLESDGDLRVLAKRVDVARLQLSSSEANALINQLLSSDERDAVRADLAADRGVRRSKELLAHYEVLAPNNPAPYSAQFERALRFDDEAGAAAVLARAKQAKGLDVSEVVESERRSASGEQDAEVAQGIDTRLAQLDHVLADAHLDAHTRAAALSLRALGVGHRGLLHGDVAQVTEGRAALVAAAAAWPALASEGSLASMLIDEAGLPADAKRWSALRRTRSAANALTALVDAHDPLADTLRSSKPWAQVLEHARKDDSLPGLDDLRLARLLGDAALEARAKAALDRPPVRMRIEMAALLTPTDVSRENLAYLDKR